MKAARGEGHAGGGGGRGRARGRKFLGGPSSPILSEDSGAAPCLRAPPAGPHFLAFFFLSLPFVVADFAATSASGAGRLLQAFLDLLALLDGHEAVVAAAAGVRRRRALSLVRAVLM